MPETFMDRFAVRDICDDEVLMNLRLIYCTQEKVGLQCVLVHVLILTEKSFTKLLMTLSFK